MKTIEAKNRKAWRKWLKENHASENEILLAYFKKHTKKPSISYKESVEEAICFGWIDGIKKRIDDERYTHRFTPRRKNSKWSKINIEIAQRMIATKQMSVAGLKAFEQRKEYEEDYSAISEEIHRSFDSKLKANNIALANFNKLSQNQRKQFLLWINSAKKEETKQRRILEAIKLLELNKRIGMK